MKRSDQSKIKIMLMVLFMVGGFAKIAWADDTTTSTTTTDTTTKGTGEHRHHGHPPHNLPPEVKAAHEKCETSVEATKPTDGKAFHAAMEKCMTAAGFPRPKDGPDGHRPPPPQDE